MNTLARWARTEWGPLYATVRERLLGRRWRAIPLALGSVCLTTALHLVHNQSWGYDFVQDVGAVRAADPLWLALLRTPLSLFVPALDLPVWGALAQILVVFGIAEICLGRRRTLAVAYAATLAGTLYARVGIWLGPHHPLGLPAADAHVVDTGPSAAVVGLAVFVGWRYGARVTAGAVIAAMVVEVLVKENLAGREHLAAIAAVLALCWVSRVRHRRASVSDRSAPVSDRSAPVSGRPAPVSDRPAPVSDRSAPVRHRSPAVRHRPTSTGSTGSGLPPIRSWNLRRGPDQRRSRR